MDFVEVVAFVPARFGICATCDEVARAFRIDLGERLDEPGDLRGLVEVLSALGSLPVRLTQPMSLRGLYLMIKHGTGKLPLVLVKGQLVHAGPIKDVESLIDKILRIFYNKDF